MKTLDSQPKGCKRGVGQQQCFKVVPLVVGGTGRGCCKPSASVGLFLSRTLSPLHHGAAGKA